MKHRDKADVHKCDEVLCKLCNVWAQRGEHQCFMQVSKPEKYEENPSYIFIDYEAYVSDGGQHVPNLVIAQYTDGQEFRFPPDGTAMEGYDVNENFGKWLFREQHKGATVFAHNFRGRQNTRK